MFVAIPPVQHHPLLNHLRPFRLPLALHQKYTPRWQLPQPCRHLRPLPSPDLTSISPPFPLLGILLSSGLSSLPIPLSPALIPHPPTPPSLPLLSKSACLRRLALPTSRRRASILRRLHRLRCSEALPPRLVSLPITLCLSSKPRLLSLLRPQPLHRRRMRPLLAVHPSVSLPHASPQRPLLRLGPLLRHLVALLTALWALPLPPFLPLPLALGLSPPLLRPEVRLPPRRRLPHSPPLPLHLLPPTRMLSRPLLLMHWLPPFIYPRPPSPSRLLRPWSSPPIHPPLPLLALQRPHGRLHPLRTPPRPLLVQPLLRLPPRRRLPHSPPLPLHLLPPTRMLSRPLLLMHWLPPFIYPRPPSPSRLLRPWSSPPIRLPLPLLALQRPHGRLHPLRRPLPRPLLVQPLLLLPPPSLRCVPRRPRAAHPPSSPSSPLAATSARHVALRRPSLPLCVLSTPCPPAAPSSAALPADIPPPAVVPPAASSPAVPSSIAASLALQLLPLLPFSHVARLALCRSLAGPYPGAPLPLPTCRLLPLPQPPPLPPTIKS